MGPNQNSAVITTSGFHIGDSIADLGRNIAVNSFNDLGKYIGTALGSVAGLAIFKTPGGAAVGATAGGLFGESIQDSLEQIWAVDNNTGKATTVYKSDMNTHISFVKATNSSSGWVSTYNVNGVVVSFNKNAEITSLTGDASNNALHGDGDNNTMRGGAGNDKLWGSGGRDTLIGNSGIDHMWSGSGHDTFRFGSHDRARDVQVGRDKVTGFGDVTKVVQVHDTSWGDNDLYILKQIYDDHDNIIYIDRDETGGQTIMGNHPWTNAQVDNFVDDIL